MSEQQENAERRIRDALLAEASEAPAPQDSVDTRRAAVGAAGCTCPTAGSVDGGLRDGEAPPLPLC